MLVGLGGNNGTTLVGGMIANREGITWMTKEGVRKPNFWGSLTQAATCRIGNYKGEEVYVPFKSLLPMVEPNDVSSFLTNVEVGICFPFYTMMCLEKEAKKEIWDSQ